MDGSLDTTGVSDRVELMGVVTEDVVKVEEDDPTALVETLPTELLPEIDNEGADIVEGAEPEEPVGEPLAERPGTEPGEHPVPVVVVGAEDVAEEVAEVEVDDPEGLADDAPAELVLAPEEPE